MLRQRIQQKKPSSREVSINITTPSIQISVSVEQQTAIDSVLNKPEYSILKQLFTRMVQEKIKDKVKENIYSYFLDRSRLLQFLDGHPLLQKVFQRQVEQRIDHFLEEVRQQLAPPKPAISLKMTTENKPAAEPSVSQEYVPSIPNLIKSKLVELRAASTESEKMYKLCEKIRDEDTIGSLCLRNDYVKEYFSILESLDHISLFLILKLTDSRNRTIYTLSKHSNRNELHSLIAKCTQNHPKTFFDILNYFQFDQNEIQELVNTIGLKKSLRNAIEALPDDLITRTWLETCLQHNTPARNFCTTKARRFIISPWDSNYDENRSTAICIRNKIQKIDATLRNIEAISPASPLSLVSTENEEETKDDLNRKISDDTESSIPMSLSNENSQALIPVHSLRPPQENTSFWIYTRCSLLFLAGIIALAYYYFHPSEEESSQYQPRSF